MINIFLGGLNDHALPVPVNSIGHKLKKMENGEEKSKSKPMWIKADTPREENDIQKNESEKLPKGPSKNLETGGVSPNSDFGHEGGGVPFSNGNSA